VQLDPVSADRARDIFEALLPEIRKADFDPARRVLLNPSGHTNPARLGQAFQPGSDVDPIAENIAILDNDIALMDPDPQLDAMVCRAIATVVRDLPLDLDRAAESIDDTDELDEEAVAAGLDQPAAMRGDRGIDRFRPDRPQSIEGSFFVHPDQARVAGDIGCQDRRQPTLSATSSLGVHCPTA
jgi:hypothetical protein